MRLRRKRQIGRAGNIVKLAEKHFAEETSAPLEGKHVVITAGPTREAVDPVRFLPINRRAKWATH